MQVAMAMSGRCYRCGHLHSNGKERELPTFISLTLRSSSATLLPPSALLLVIFVSKSLRTDTNTDMYDIILYTILQQQVKHLSRKSSRNTAAASK
jgi:hypothetical protein